MPLFSQLFKAEPKLIACQLQDTAHVTKGASGSHVQKIQAALTIIDNAVIDGREQRAQTYGPSTAAAVLAYKKRRNIINLTYQTQADDIVGKMTITALDKEMVQFEHAGRVSNACAGKRRPVVIV